MPSKHLHTPREWMKWHAAPYLVKTAIKSVKKTLETKKKKILQVTKCVCWAFCLCVQHKLYLKSGKRIHSISTIFEWEMWCGKGQGTSKKTRRRTEGEVTRGTPEPWRQSQVWGPWDDGSVRPRTEIFKRWDWKHLHPFYPRAQWNPLCGVLPRQWTQFPVPCL